MTDREQTFCSCRTRIEAAEWVASDAYDFPDSYAVSLTKDPNRDDFFKHILPDLDYEPMGVGSTVENPRWAWEFHPWFKALDLTSEECEEALRRG